MRNILSYAVLLTTFALPHQLRAEAVMTEYDVYWNGLRVFTASSALNLSPESYEHAVKMRSRGILRWFVKAEMALSVSGVQQNGELQSRVFEAESLWNKKTYARTVYFDDDQKGTLERDISPQEDDEEYEKEPVPEELSYGPDPLTLLANVVMRADEQLLDNQERTFEFTSFDGWRSMAYTATCEQDEDQLNKDNRSVYAGRAIKCKIDGTQTGGFWRAKDPEQQAKDERERREAEEEAEADADKHGVYVWFAYASAESLMVPVRMEFRGRRKLTAFLVDTNIDFSNSATKEALN